MRPVDSKRARRVGDDSKRMSQPIWNRSLMIRYGMSQCIGTTQRSAARFADWTLMTNPTDPEFWKNQMDTDASAILARATAQAERMQKHLDNQKAIITRMMDRWNAVKQYCEEMGADNSDYKDVLFFMAEKEREDA